MKRIGSILAIILAMALPVSSQFVEIPDTAFLHALIDEGVDTNGDSLISYAEAEVITSIIIDVPAGYGGCYGTNNIVSYSGIEAFVNLDTLEISCGEAISLDLSKNQKLKRVACMGNRLTYLDVSKCSELRELFCDFNQLTNLDISSCTELRELNCSNNQLKLLDVSNCTLLTDLLCSNNQLTCIDLSNNKRLDYLSITGMPSLYEVCGKVIPWFIPEETLINPFPIFTYGSPNIFFAADCKGNQYVSISDSSFLSALIEADVDRDSDSLISVLEAEIVKSLDISEKEIYSLSGIEAFGQLVYLRCYGNNLKELDVSQNQNLIELECGLNPLTFLDLSKNYSLKTVKLFQLPYLRIVCLWRDEYLMPPNYIHLDSPTRPEFKDCGGPQVTLVNGFYKTGYIAASSTERGMMYLVPSETTKDLTQIMEVCLDSVSASANQRTFVSILGVPDGVYWLYARDWYGNLSEPTPITVYGTGVDCRLEEIIKIYPNPVNDILVIQSEGPTNYSLVMASANGKMIFCKEMEGLTHQFDLSSFPKGVYFITIRSDNFVTTRKIVKL